MQNSHNKAVSIKHLQGIEYKHRVDKKNIITTVWCNLLVTFFILTFFFYILIPEIEIIINGGNS